MRARVRRCMASDATSRRSRRTRLVSSLRTARRSVKVTKRSRLPRVRSFRFVPFPTPLPHSTYWHWTCVAADERGDGADVMGIGKMFSDPNLFSKLAANPRTAKLLADASFMQKACIIIIPLFSPLWDAHTRLIFSAQTYTTEPAARAESAQWRPTHDRCPRRTHGY